MTVSYTKLSLGLGEINEERWIQNVLNKRLQEIKKKKQNIEVKWNEVQENGNNCVHSGWCWNIEAN